MANANFFYFYDYATTEEFYVKAQTRDAAARIANFYFEHPSKGLLVTELAVELSGCDLYD